MQEQELIDAIKTIMRFCRGATNLMNERGVEGGSISLTVYGNEACLSETGIDVAAYLRHKPNGTYTSVTHGHVFLMKDGSKHTRDTLEGVVKWIGDEINSMPIKITDEMIDRTLGIDTIKQKDIAA